MSRRTLSRRGFLSGLGIGAAAVALAACGQAATPTAAPAKPADKPTEKPAAADKPAAAPTAASAQPAAGVGQITFMTWGSAERLKIWEEGVVGGFNRRHPGMKATLLEAPADYEAKLLTMLAGGTAPDVFRLSLSYSVDVFAKDVCFELDPYLKRDNFRIEDQTSPPYAQCQYKGKWYGVPHGAAGNFVVWYNRDLFKKQGVEFPKEGWSWDQFLETAKALTKDTNGDGKVDQWGVSPTVYQYPWAFIWSNGGEELSEDGKRYEIDKPPAVEAMQMLVDLRTKHKVVPAPAEIPQGLGDIFLSNRVAMNYSGAWYEATAKEAKFDFGMVLHPKMKGEHTAYAEQNVTAGYKTTKQPDAAWEMLKYLISEENQRVESLSGLNGPSMQKILKSDEFLQPQGAPYDRKPVVPGLLVKTRGLTVIPQARKIRDDFRQKMTPAWNGERKVEEVAPQVVETAKKVIAENA